MDMEHSGWLAREGQQSVASLPESSLAVIVHTDARSLRTSQHMAGVGGQMLTGLCGVSYQYAKRTEAIPVKGLLGSKERECRLGRTGCLQT